MVSLWQRSRERCRPHRLPPAPAAASWYCRLVPPPWGVCALRGALLPGLAESAADPGVSGACLLARLHGTALRRHHSVPNPNPKLRRHHSVPGGSADSGQRQVGGQAQDGLSVWPAVGAGVHAAGQLSLRVAPGARQPLTSPHMPWPDRAFTAPLAPSQGCGRHCFCWTSLPALPAPPACSTSPSWGWTAARA